MMKRFSRRKRGAGEGKQSAIDPGEWLPKIVESGIVDVPSLESWTEPGIPETVATIARGERADATQVIVAFSPRSATEATLAGLSAAQFAVAASEFSGVLVIVAPQWPAGARRLLGLLGQTPYAVEPVAAPVLASGRASVEAETGGQVLAVSASQLASRMTSIDGRAAFTRAALGLEGLAAKHGGAVRIGIDRVELVVLARRVAEIRLEGDSAVLETQIGGRVTTSLSGADLASALDGLEGQLRRRLNDRKVREGEEGLRGRVIASLGTGSELRGLRPWPMPGADLDLIDAVGVNGEGDPVVVAVREELEWTALGAVLEAIGPLGSLLPVLFAETAPPLRLGTSRLLFVAERFADGLERALAAMTVAYELRKVSATAGASVDLVSSGAGEGAQSRAPRRGRRRGGRGRSRGGEESSDEASPPTGPAADIAAAEEGEGEGRRGSRSRSAASAESAESADSAAGGEDDAEDRDENGPGRSRRRRRPRRGRGAAADGAATDGAATDGKARTGRESEEGRSAEGSRPRRARFEEVSLMDLDDAPEPTDDARSTSVADGSAAEGSESGGSGARRSSSRRGRRGGRGDNRRGGADRASSNADDASEEPPKEADAEGVAEEDLVDADDLSEILARLTENEPDFDSSDSTEESFDDEEEIDEDEAQSQRRQARETRRRSKGDDTDRPAARGRAAILVHADRDSLFSATLLARDIRQLEGMWIYPQEELMTFFRSIATDLRDDTPIFVVGFTPSPARDVIQASALYRGRLTWFDRQAWPPEDRVALRDSLGGDAIHGGEGMDSTLPLVLETCARRSRFSDKLVDLATSRFTQHDFERWGRLWRWRAGEIAAKTGDIRSDIAPLLAGRPSDLAKEAALVELPPAPPEVAWVAENDFRLVHFGGHVMVVLEADASLDTHLSARVARERYSATLSLSYRAGESTFILGGDEINGKRALDYVAVAEHLVNKLEWVEARPDSDHVSRFHVRDLDRNPERLEEVIGEIAMGRSLLER